MRTATLFCFLMFVACEPEPTAPAPVAASSRSAAATGGTKADAGTAVATTNTADPLTASANVMRHLPGTAITTATGKYVYLVQDDGTVAPFASAAIAAASGYPAAMIITVSVDELRCYGRGNQITAALSAPAAGTLRDGMLVKEKGKTDTYAVSGGVAWPIKNGTVFVEAGYDWDNVIEIASGTLVRSVDAVGDCVAGIACLDEAYLTSCSQDTSIGLLPTSTVTATATSTTPVSTGSTAATATATSASTGTATPITNIAAANITRHLPGTAITTATGKYIYLVQGDGTAAPFASAAVAAASGYPAAMVITVSAAELYCYSRGDQITAALPALEAGALRDGTLVKEKGRSDTYAVSGGIAWPIKNGTVFVEAGYNWDDIIEIAAGSLAGQVDAVGDCVAGIDCLDETYLTSCGQDTGDENVPTSTATATATATASAAPPSSTATASATAVATQTPTSTATVSAVNTQTVVTTSTPPATIASSATATASATATTVVSPTAIATATATSAPVATVSVTATATATSTPPATAPTTTTATTATASSTGTATPPSAIDLTWVWAADDTDLCLNAAYFAGDDEAVLLIWSGPGADAAKGPVAIESEGRFCWDFAERGKGLYYFWADVPLDPCSTDICFRDGIDGNGAMYMTAPKATAAARKWLHCEPTGCDGAAYWDGSAFTPMGD